MEMQIYLNHFSAERQEAMGGGGSGAPPRMIGGAPAAAGGIGEALPRREGLPGPCREGEGLAGALQPMIWGAPFCIFPPS